MAIRGWLWLFREGGSYLERWQCDEGYFEELWLDGGVLLVIFGEVVGVLMVVR